jgi:hypothetical protein
MVPRRLALLFLSAAPLLAQGPPVPSSIAEYLGLTPAQVARFVRNLDEHYARAAAVEERRDTVEAEIAAEALRDPVDPMALGLRLAELETTRREFVAQGREIIARHRSLLTPTQAARLEIVVAAMMASNQLGAIASDAACLYLMEGYSGPGSFCHFMYAGGIASQAKDRARRTTEERSALEQFLQLTPEQIARYRANQREFMTWVHAPNGYYEANQEACRALASSPLDPMRIGIPAARLATLTQRHLQRARELIAANQAILTDSQRLRLNILEEARALAPTAAFAESEAFLARADGQPNFSFSGEGGYSGSGLYMRQRNFGLSCYGY